MAAVAVVASLAPGAAADSVPRGIAPDVALSDLLVSHWTTDDGLPTNVLLSVRQLSAGDLWVAGFGGLARFDGFAFEAPDTSGASETRPGSFYDLLEDGDRIWVASQSNGLWKLDNGVLSPFQVDPSALSIRTLTVDRAGVLWVGSAERGVFRVEEDRLVPLGVPRLSQVTIRAILEDRAGVRWFGTEGRGLVRLSAGDDSTVGADNWSVTSLWEAREGGLWIGRSDGLSRLTAGSITAFPELDGVEIFAVSEDDYGSLWIASEQGVYRRAAAATRFEHLAALGGAPLRSVNRIVFDHEASAWVSSYSSGLFQLRPGKFRNYTTAEGLTTTRVNSVYEWGEGRFLVGGDRGAIDTIENGAVSRLRLRTRLPEVRVRGFFDDSRGNLWISSYAGLLRVGANGDEKLLTTADGLPVNQVRLVFEDSAGTRWIGTRGGGLVRLHEDGRFTAIGRADGLASDFVLAVVEDLAGRLLIGTQGGLSVIERDGGITTYTVEDGLPGNLVFNVFVDGENSAWIATTDGLARLRDGEIRKLTARQGLPTDAVYDYREDGLGYAWMTSSQGLIRAAKSDLEEALAGRRRMVEFELLDRSDGIADRQCTGATRMARAADGRLWIPTLGGLSVIDPRVVPRNPVPPPVRIRRLTVDGRRVPLPTAPDEVVEIAPGRRRFDFSFSALSFQAPAKVEVRYRLDGFDEGWIDAGREREALYTGLPPGEYVFRVRAANNDGVWNDTEATLRLAVQPHFYQTPAFFVLAAAALLSGPWVFYRWRVGTARRRGDELERMLAEQVRLEGELTELIVKLETRNEQLEHFTYAISHDLKSPLHTIKGFLGLVEKDHAAGDEERFRTHVATIRQAVDSMNVLLEGLLKLWRTEKGEPQIVEVDLGEVARRAVGALEGKLADRAITVEIADDLPTVRADESQMMEVLQNLMENAAKFMGEQPRPRIQIGCRRGERGPVFFVRDNGIGIDRRYHDKVFAVFERLDPGSEGTGLGLAIVKRVVQAHGGRIWIESGGRGKGTTFCFILGT